MDENQEKSVENKETEAAKAKATSDRVKRMRGWLGINSNTSFGGHADSFEPLLPGEGHSGWNR